jgi:hypothetical protein
MWNLRPPPPVSPAKNALHGSHFADDNGLKQTFMRCWKRNFKTKHKASYSKLGNCAENVGDYVVK